MRFELEAAREMLRYQSAVAAERFTEGAVLAIDNVETWWRTLAMAGGLESVVVELGGGSYHSLRTCMCSLQVTQLFLCADAHVRTQWARPARGPFRVPLSLLQIPVIGSIARGDQRLNYSMRGSMELPEFVKD